MNWTGGQLQRHHNRSGLLTKSQKQNFARVRLQKNTGSSTRNKHEDKIETNGNQVTEEPVSHSTGSQSTHSDNDLTEVKRQLLKEPDWAAVSATRPLELGFTSVEEVERFGKRRKLNEKDRKRLVAANNNGSTLFGRPRPLRRGRNSSSVIDTIEEDIQFEFNRQPVAQSNDSSGVATNSMSSQSMLLDHEGSPIADQDLGKENLTATWIINLFPRSQLSQRRALPSSV
ncbi:palmitoyl-protein thioesterase 1 [Penicillium digitatum]|uniref:Palmitoyl-protein thioesterase 1 n=1 Tax=Penicillium digitatum TaxID=36651 RepID=A0A7T6XU15_PENDI|nr:palmitoyl-protein thioesterase 1 [Penicillium digitatum]